LNSGKKKGWFGGKPDSKGIAAGISNFFSKKDKGAASPESSKRQTPVPAPRSPDVSRRSGSRASDRSTPDRAITPDNPSPDRSPSVEELSSKDEGECLVLSVLLVHNQCLRNI